MPEDEERSWITGGEEASPPPWQTRGAGGAFPATRWSLVIDAAAENTLAVDSLEILCRDYWYPLYSFVRRQGKSAHDAQDLTQGFFEYLLAGNYLARADREKGKLRTFLLAALKYYSAYHYRKETAQKRGGGAAKISIDEELAEKRFHNEPRADEAGSPENLFDRRWAMTVLETVLKKLGDDYRAAGKEELFSVLSGFLTLSGTDTTIASAAEKLGMKEGAVKVAVHRLRKRYRQALHDEILATVRSPEDVEEEIASLMQALGS